MESIEGAHRGTLIMAGRLSLICDAYEGCIHHFEDGALPGWVQWRYYGKLNIPFRSFPARTQVLASIEYVSRSIYYIATPLSRRKYRSFLLCNLWYISDILLSYEAG
jgi:hypothetical protein